MPGYRRHWIVATLIVAVFAVQVVFTTPLQGQDWTTLALIAVVVAAAAFAHHHVIATVCATAGTLAATMPAPDPWAASRTQRAGLSELMRLDQMPLTASEAVALTALVVVLVWTAPPATAAICTAVLVATSVLTAYVRTAELPLAVRA